MVKAINTGINKIIAPIQQARNVFTTDGRSTSQSTKIVEKLLKDCELYRQAGSYKIAREKALEILEHEPGNIDAIFIAARSALNLRDYSVAKKEYE